MIRYLKSYSLYREGILELEQFDATYVKELLENAKVLQQGLCQIYDFEHYRLDKEYGIGETQSVDEIKQLVESLRAQYRYLYLNEETFEIYKKVKDRTQQFWIEEFSFLGDMPVFRGQSNWIGGVSIRPLYQGIHKYYCKYVQANLNSKKE